MTDTGAVAGRSDVLVVGAGVVGSSVAYFARRRGMSVTVLEKSWPGSEASGRNGGGVRQQKRNPAELPLAMEAVKLWTSFKDEFGGDFEYVQGGNLQVAFDDREAEALRRSTAAERGRGLGVDYLEADDLREVAPGVSPLAIGAQHCPTDGTANPIKASRYVAILARRAGADIRPMTEATRIEVGDDGVATVATRAGLRFEAGQVVLANGPWVNGLTEPLGVKLPILPRRSQNVVTTAYGSRVLGQFVSGNTVYVRQTKAGNFHIGGSGDWEPLSFEKETTARTIARFAGRAAELFPAVAQTSVLRSWAGILDITPDRIAIIDHLPGIPGVLVAAGFSAHGFCLGPAVGKVLAEMLAGEAPSLPLEPFRAGRFPAGMADEAWYRPEVEPPPTMRGGGV